MPAKNDVWTQRPSKDKSSKTTTAYIYFNKSISKFRGILHSAADGIEEAASVFMDSGKVFEKQIIDELGSLPSLENYTPSSNIEFDLTENDDGSATFTAHPELAAALAKGFEKYGKDHAELENDLNNIVIVAIWSAFEGYIQEVLAEIYQTNLALLSSDRPVKISEIVLFHEDIKSYLIDLEIHHIGRKNLSEINMYLKSKFNRQIPSTHLKFMSDIYTLRNIIAHTAGRVRSSQIDLVPNGVMVKDRWLRPSQDYVLKAMNCIEDSVIKLDMHLFKFILPAQS